MAGRLIAGLVVVALIVVVVVLATHNPSRGHSTPGNTSSTTTASIVFQHVSVFHLERNADDAAHVGYAIDGKLDTAWQTDHYFLGAPFGNLRHGLGLALTLDTPQTLHHLQVQSSTTGWSAEIYVANSVPNPPSLAPWGSPVDTRQNIAGSTTFDLQGRQGSAVLLWLTNLGPNNQASIAEVTAS